MGSLDRYRYLLNYNVDITPYKPYTPPPVKRRVYVMPEALPITVADTDARSRDFVTAHDLKDYRRTAFNLVLLPKVELSYDIIAKEVYGLSEYM